MYGYYVRVIELFFKYVFVNNFDRLEVDKWVLYLILESILFGV